MPHAADKSGEDKDAASDEVDVTPSQSAAVCAALASAITWKLISEGERGGTPTFTHFSFSIFTFAPRAALRDYLNTLINAYYAYIEAKGFIYENYLSEDKMVLKCFEYMS